MDTCLTDVLLKRYLNGQVCRDEAAVREKHLNTCSDCVRRVERLRDQSEVWSRRFAVWATARLPKRFSVETLTSTAQRPSLISRLARRRVKSFATTACFASWGEVYLALHVRLEKHVALKRLRHDRCDDREAIARFEREMKLVGKLEHENIVRALDAGEENGTYFLVMEYIDGVDLGRLSRSIRGFPVAAACELVRQAATGLQHAHDNALIHRDIKPLNLMLSSRRQVKVLDLGLAQFLRTISPDNALTGTAQILGTIAYMSPEQRQGHNSDIRSDVYSLGVTLFKLPAGTLPPGSNRFTPAFPRI